MKIHEIKNRSKQIATNTTSPDLTRLLFSQDQKVQLASKCTLEHPILPGGMPDRSQHRQHDGEASTSDFCITPDLS